MRLPSVTLVLNLFEFGRDVVGMGRPFEAIIEGRQEDKLTQEIAFAGLSLRVALMNIDAGRPYEDALSIAKATVTNAGLELGQLALTDSEINRVASITGLY